ncbi:MAG: hypothetical protein OXO54_10255 [Chloroflexota bacterium]|nr:hypothetical protein [Chloroflexota bacterium]
MRCWLERHNLGFAGSLAAAAVVAAMLYAWIDAGSVVSETRINVDSWGWKIWQFAALLITVPGVWWLWRNTRNVKSAWALILVGFAAVVFVNYYGDHSEDFSASAFGENTQAVWESINALVVGFAVAGALALWQRGGTAYRVGALLALAFGVLDLINATFLQNGTLWQILDPLIILAALYWAVDEVRPAASSSDGG